MQVKVLFFGQLKDVVGGAEERVELPAGACVRDLLNHFQQRFPRWEEFRPSIAVAVNQHYAEGGAALKPGDEVAFLPPVSGGGSEPEASAAQGRVELSREPIATQRVVDALKTPSDGAVVVFEGIVRNHSGGRETLYLDYEAYRPMALEKMRAIVADLQMRYPVSRVTIVHRLGRLQIGETSVLIAVCSAHRAAAFEACRHAIESLKRTVPIWKKEYFADGAVWVEGERLPAPPESTPVRQES